MVGVDGIARDDDKDSDYQRQVVHNSPPRERREVIFLVGFVF